jgi:hypothetical protein
MWRFALQERLAVISQGSLDDRFAWCVMTLRRPLRGAGYCVLWADGIERRERGSEVAVPYDQLHLQADKDQTKITMPGASKEALKAMPTFTYSG